ncbi:unnamed protein product [Cladocopium goreaui]|uniref:F-box domain-containing protein n=1 Tax=Cladocopium goreaui TaxID=2562237 RepID=A0A9P1CQL7_9DINO|nr:unnamed protein product [Cladocopium goreaui]
MEIPLLTTGTDDEILRCVFELSSQRVQLRGVSRRWMSVWRSFPSHWTVKFDPPSGPVTLELEVNQAMSKLILTCELELRSGHSGRSGRSTVARMDWVPSYFGSRNGHVLHELKNEAADATWRLASRIFQGASAAPGEGQLRLRSAEKLVLCAVDHQQVELFRCLIDCRKNKQLQSLDPLDPLSPLKKCCWECRTCLENPVV